MSHKNAFIFVYTVDGMVTDDSWRKIEEAAWSNQEDANSMLTQET